MRILWLSNAPWAGSGYGEQTALFTQRLQALGHDVACVANYGLQAGTFEWGGMTIFPGDNHWSNDRIGTYAEIHNADWVITLTDSWVMKPKVWPDDLRMAIWAPIDHVPVPPDVAAVLRDDKVRPIAMSKFGEQWMHRFALDPLYVPHGVDTKLFRPQREIRDAVRDELGVPRDAFLVAMVAANKSPAMLPRKSFPQAFEAFARFAAKHDDAWLYVHTQQPEGGNGIHLDTLAVATRCPEGRVNFPPAKAWHVGMSRQLMANLYAGFDVLLNPSMGEGFGIPILEAQACGVPVIASDHSAMTELTQAGWLVSGDPWWDALQQSFLIVPYISSITNALEAAYEARDDMKLREAAVAFASQYDADRVTAEYWVPALEALDGPRVVPPLNGKSRQVRRAEERKRSKAGA